MGLVQIPSVAPPCAGFSETQTPGYHPLSLPAPSRAYFHPLANSSGQITRWSHVCFPPSWWTRRVTLLPAERRGPTRSQLHIWTRGSMMSHRRQTMISGDIRSPALGTTVLFPQLWEGFFSCDETAWAPSKRAAPRLTSTVGVRLRMEERCIDFVFYSHVDGAPVESPRS